MAEKENKKNEAVKNEKPKASLPPSGFKVVMREVLHDKVALTAFIIIVLILIFTFGGSLFLNKSQITEINIADAYYGWGEAGHLLGTDDGGRDILKLLIMGGRNSILIGVSVTVITEIIGLVVGLVSGYYGGVIDSIIMRIVDFVQILPPFPIIIV
ncbi:MAG: peptide ABC transporter permease, partial [Lactobacillus sp.]|nr:peptide ABC transporter permease [Lactobacillus sp.]